MPVLSWIKRELGSLIRGFILFFLAFSGLGCALSLRFLKYNGAIIAIGGIIVEGIAMILCYIIFKGYLKSGEDTKISDEKPKKS